MAEKKKVYKFPKSIGSCADLLWNLQEKRRQAQRLVDAREEEEKALRAHIIEVLPKSETTGVSGKLANVQVQTKVVGTVEDWDALWKYILKTKSTDLIGKRLVQEAVDARWSENKVIPGVKSFNAIKLSLTKVKVK
jgi:hypothetical protein